MARTTTRRLLHQGPGLVCAVLIALCLALSACDDPPPPAAATTPPPAAAPPPPAAAAPKGIERKPLGDEDFIESLELNRDPFRSYLAEFATPMRRTVRRQRKVLLQRYGLEELRLIAVVSGGVRPRAMFRDPTGLGVSVKRGDYVSKNEGRIKQILPDKVIVQIEEHSEEQERLADRVIELHTKLDRETRGSQP